MEQEIKATVNGWNITRTVGTKFPFYITVKYFERGGKQFYSFKTLKAAKEFAAKL